MCLQVIRNFMSLRPRLLSPIRVNDEPAPSAGSKGCLFDMIGEAVEVSSQPNADSAPAHEESCEDSKDGSAKRHDDEHEGVWKTRTSPTCFCLKFLQQPVCVCMQACWYVNSPRDCLWVRDTPECVICLLICTRVTLMLGRLDHTWARNTRSLHSISDTHTYTWYATLFWISILPM